MSIKTVVTPDTMYQTSIKEVFARGPKYLMTTEHADGTLYVLEFWVKKDRYAVWFVSPTDMPRGRRRTGWVNRKRSLPALVNADRIRLAHLVVDLDAAAVKTLQ